MALFILVVLIYHCKLFSARPLRQKETHFVFKSCQWLEARLAATGMALQRRQRACVFDKGVRLEECSENFFDDTKNSESDVGEEDMAKVSTLYRGV